MQIISGKYRGKKLEFHSNKETRPTKNRIRENVFNLIASKVRGAQVLDLFAGSGAHGAEALSRGARHVVLNDADANAVEVIKQNVKTLESNYEIYNLDYKELLRKLGSQKRSFDLIFLDPPYESGFGHEAIQILASLDMISDGGTIIFETDKHNDFQLDYKRFLVEGRNYGKIRIYVIKKCSG